MADYCTDCERQMVTSHKWQLWTQERRDNHRKTHARVGHRGFGLCEACLKYRRRNRRELHRRSVDPHYIPPTKARNDEEIRFSGTWVRRGLIQVPVQEKEAS